MARQGTNPFKGRVIPKGKIQWAIENSQSIAGAAKLLRVSYNTFKKYAKYLSYAFKTSFSLLSTIQIILKSITNTNLS